MRVFDSSLHTLATQKTAVPRGYIVSVAYELLGYAVYCAKKLVLVHGTATHTLIVATGVPVVTSFTVCKRLGHTELVAVFKTADLNGLPERDIEEEVCIFGG